MFKLACSLTEYSDGTSLVPYAPIKLETIIWEVSFKNTIIINVTTVHCLSNYMFYQISSTFFVS